MKHKACVTCKGHITSMQRLLNSKLGGVLFVLCSGHKMTGTHCDLQAVDIRLSPRRCPLSEPSYDFVFRNEATEGKKLMHTLVSGKVEI